MEKASIGVEEFIEAKIDAIINSAASERQKLREFRGLLDLPPLGDWIRFADDPRGLNLTIKKDGQSMPYPYVPIGIVETLLKLFFVNPQIIIVNAVQVFNAIQVTACIKYTCPITGKEMQQYGIGAKQVQLRTGAPAFDLTQINNAAVEKAAPAARALAIKDAADRIGKIFGADIARDHTLALTSALANDSKWRAFKATAADKVALHLQVQGIFAECKTPAELDKKYDAIIAPLLEKHGINKEAYRSIAENKKTLLLPETTSHNLHRLDIGELSGAELIRINAQADVE